MTQRAGRTTIAGVDGCPEGWVVVLWSVDDPSRAAARVCADFASVLALDEAPDIIAVDMPIGLPERIAGTGGRAPEHLVRPLLGQRQSSVFSIPPRDAVMASDYAAARAAALSRTDPPRSVAKQAFMIFPKIREIDRLMTPALEDRVYECHPELAFWAMNGETALDLPKKIRGRPNPEGLELRRNLLRSGGVPDDVLGIDPRTLGRVGPDDLLDACACAWSARRILDGIAHCFPSDPPRDGKGLRMAIWA